MLYKIGLCNINPYNEKSLEAATSKLFSDHLRETIRKQYVNSFLAETPGVLQAEFRGKGETMAAKTTKIHRSAKTGQFVTPGYVKTHPDTTVTETKPAPKQPKK